MLRQIAQRAQYGAHFLHPPLKIGDVRFSETFHFARRSLAIAPQREKGANFLQRKAEIARAADELQH